MTRDRRRLAPPEVPRPPRPTKTFASREGLDEAAGHDQAFHAKELENDPDRDAQELEKLRLRNPALYAEMEKQRREAKTRAQLATGNLGVSLRGSKK